MTIKAVMVMDQLQELLQRVMAKAPKIANTPDSLVVEDRRVCKCDGRGWYVVTELIQDDGKEFEVHRSEVCICQKIAKAKANEIPPEFRDKTFDDLQIYREGWNKEEPKDPGNALAVAVAKEFVENFEKHQENRTGPFFFGKPGRGKSLICSIIFQELCNKGYYPVYLHFRRFLDKLIESYKHEEEFGEREYYSVISEADVVIIDELRTIKTKNESQWQQDKIAKILEVAKLIVVDSNFELSWIEQNMGDYIASRINRFCGLPVYVGGPDWRAIIGKQLQERYLKRVAGN